MNSFEKIIGKFSLEQKIRLITSLKQITNSQIEDYIVPTINFEFNFCDIIENFINPSINSLGSIYDTNIIEKYGIELGRCLSHLKNKKIINIPLNTKDINMPSFSSSKLVTAKMASYLAKGIEKGGYLASYGIVPGLNSIDLNEYINDILYTYKVSLSYYKPFALVLDSPDALDIITKDYEYLGLKVVITRDKNELINSLNQGAELTIASGFTINYAELEILTEAYKKAKKKLRDDEISHTEFRNMLVRSEILNPEAIDKALISLLEKLSYMDNILNNHQKYDMEKLKNVENYLSKESVILLKNDDNVLPLKRENKYAFIGDVLFNPNLNTNREDLTLDIEKVIDVFNLDTVGICHGYITGGEINKDLITKAQRLVNDSEFAIVFLDAIDGKIPDNEIDLLNNIKDLESTIIPVVITNRRVDLSCLLEYKAILVQTSDSISNISSVIDVITGRFNPTGRLPFAVKSIIDDSSFKDDDNLLFPLGYGLNYSKFNYKSITIDENGILLAVTNESKLSGSDMLLFTSKFLGNDNELNYIRDFITVDLEGHESKLVEFKYNFESFSIYDLKKSEMLIREGMYQVQLMTSFNNVLSEKEIYLSKLLKRGDTSCDLEESYESANDSYDALNYDVASTNNFLAFPLKLATIAIIDLYLLILSIYLMVLFKKALPITVILLVLIIVLVVSSLLAYNIVKRNKEKDKINTFTQMVNDFEDYKVEIHETYNEPIVDLTEELIKQEVISEMNEVKEEEPEEVQIKLNYDAFGVVVEDDLVYTNDDTFDDLLERFIKYALNNGCMIESLYARLLLSSIFSTKLLLIKGSSKEKNIELIKILNSFFGNSEDFFVDLLDKEPIDIYWENDNEEDSYKLSKFANNIIRSKHLSKRFNIIAFDNVNETTLPLITEYINFSKTPKECHLINIGENHSIQIPDNTLIVLFVDDFINNYSIYDNSISLDLVTSNNQTEKEDIILKYNDYQYLTSLINNSRNKEFLNEEVWRKIDSFFDDKIFGDFKLDNRHLVQAEKLSSLLLHYKFDDIQSLNYMFILKLIPIISYLEKTNNRPSFKQEVIDLLEKLFEDRTENTVKALRNS